MNRYVMVRRLSGPAFVLLTGALALLNQADILSWGKSWPFFIILAGVLALAERAALATAQSGAQNSDQPYPGQQYPGQQYPGQPYPGYAQAAAPAAGGEVPEARFAADAAPVPTAENTAIVPSLPGQIVKDTEGGR